MIEILKKKYGFNTPIFLNELEIDGKSGGAMRQSFKRMVDKSIIKRFDYGIYYIPKQSELFKKPMSLDSNSVIVAKYIRRNSNVFGYYSGMTFANQIGITSQVPAEDEIKTNKESTKGRTIELSYRRIKIIKPRIKITKENWMMLQLLDLINEYEKWSEVSYEKVIEIMNEYILEQKLEKIEMVATIKSYPDRVAKRLIESGLAYVFTWKQRSI